MLKWVVLGFVVNVVFNGDLIKNFFNFKNVKVKKLEISINGESMSIRLFEFDFENNLYLRFYLSLY